MSLMSDSSKVSLSSFLVFPRQVVTWSENRHDNRNRNRIGVAGTWITHLPLPSPLYFTPISFNRKDLMIWAIFFKVPAVAKTRCVNAKHINEINPF